MIALVIAEPITGLTPIPLTVTDDGYTLTIGDSQPIIPPNAGGLGVEVEGTAVAQEPGQTVSVEGTEIAAGGSTTYDIDVTFSAPNDGAYIGSLTVTGLPDGCYADVTYDDATGGATIHIHVGPSAVAGTYTYNIQAVIENPRGAVPSGPRQTIQLYDVFADPSTPPTEFPDFALTFGGTSNPMAQLSQQDAGFIFTPPLTPPDTYTAYLSSQNPWLTSEFLDYPTQEFFTVRLNPTAPLSPGFYRFALSSVHNGETVTLPMVYAVYGGNIQSNPINLEAQMTIGPAWPPPQMLTTDGALTLSTDDYVYSINQGDEIDIEISAEGFTAFTGYWNFFLSEQSPERIVGTTPRFQNFWCVFPSNNKPATYTPTPGTPVLITTAKLTTTLTTPPGVYALTIAVGVPTLNPLYMTLLQTGIPTNTGKFLLYLGSEPVIEGSPPYIFCNVYIEGIGGWFDWVTLSIDAPAGVTVATSDVNPSKGGWGLRFTPAADLAPGTYPVNLTGTNGGDNATLQLTLTIVDTSSEFNGVPSATINVQVMDVGGEQATVPSALLSGTMTNPLSVSRRAQTGLVATSHQGRQVFRALSIPTNRRTPPQVAARARHVSITSAQLIQNDTILEAWSLAAALFPGHDLIPADVESGVTAMATYLPMTPAQFQYLCQSTQMAFGNTPTTLPAPVQPPYALASDEQIAWFPQAMSMRANIVYNTAYECIGFTLAYTYLPTGTDFGGYASQSQAPDAWIISATSATASSVSSKSGSGFSVLGYYIGLPTPAQILKDWKAVYGSLPPKGTIYFSVRPADPFTGVTGMQMTSRAHFVNGTLSGAIIPPNPEIYFDISTIWVGPKATSTLPASAPAAPGYEQSGAAIIPPGGAIDVQLFFQGVAAFGGNGWTPGAPYAGTITCVGRIASVNAANKTPGLLNTRQPIPPITITFNPATLDIPSGDTLPRATTATFHMPAATPSGTWLFHLEGTDGKQTLSQKILVKCDPAAPSASGLSLTPMVSAVPIVPGTDRVINFTLSNPNSAPQILEIFFPGDMIYYGGSGPIGSITFSIVPGTNPVTVPAGSPGTPGTVSFALHIHPTGTITTGKDFNLLVTATNPYITLAALLDFST